jgi:acetyl-CoA acetyltransferase
MRRVGILSSARILSARDVTRTAPELVFHAARQAVADSGLRRGAIDLTVSGSSDVLDGRSFGFAHALEALGVHPATLESHLEMDGAWAAFYAYLKILSGEANRALVVAWGKCSEASLHHVTDSQLDPFCLAPLGLDHVTSAALQADEWMARTGATISVLDAIARRTQDHARRNASVRAVVEETERDEAVASPLWRRHCARAADGACALVMVSEEAAPQDRKPVAWVRGADHRTETGAIGCRDLAALPSAVSAAARARAIAGWQKDAPLDVAELHARFAHQEAMLVEALGVGAATINPSGGALAADPMMATGLVRLAECALQVTSQAGEHQVPGARRGLAHATAGHALQQNLVWLLEGEGSP